LPDIAENQRQYPQPSSQKGGCGFPVRKVTALFPRNSDAVLHVMQERALLKTRFFEEGIS